MLKCGYAHPGFFARFLEYTGLKHESTGVGNENGLVLIEGG